MRLRCFDVGQGNSIVVEIPPGPGCPRSRFGIVDCHYIKSRHPEPPALAYLKSRGVVELEFAILTHPDHDHAFGMGSVVDYFSTGGRRINYFIESIYACYYTAQLQSIQNEMALGKPYQTLHSEELFHIHDVIVKQETTSGLQHILGPQTNLDLDLGNSLRIGFVAPSAAAKRREAEAVLDDVTRMAAGRPPKTRNANEGSLGFIVKYQDKTIFFSGDVPDRVWQEALPVATAGVRSIRSDAIIVTHHGSDHGNSAAFWDAVSHISASVAGPQSVAVISCGYANIHKHPSEKVLNRIISRKNKLFCINLGHPCAHLDVKPGLSGMPKILASALTEINKTLLERAVAPFATPAPGICSGTIELEIQAPGTTIYTYREQNSTCAYVDGKPHLTNPY